MTALERRIAELADATGKPVAIGRHGHKEDWFAHCDGIEWEAPTARRALEAVARELIRRAELDEQKARLAARLVERLREASA